MMAAPFTITINTVTGDTGGIFHDGGAVTGQLIKEHGLAHIGAAYNGH